MKTDVQHSGSLIGIEYWYRMDVEIINILK